MTLEGKQEQTKHIRRSNNPSWDEKFRLFAMLKRSVLCVACFDHENMTADELLVSSKSSCQHLPPIKSTSMILSLKMEKREALYVFLFD